MKDDSRVGAYGVEVFCGCIEVAFFIVSLYFFFEFIRCDMVSDVLPVAEAVAFESLKEEQLFLAGPVVRKERVVEFVDDVIVLVYCVFVELNAVRETVHTDVSLGAIAVDLHLLADILLACVAMHSVRGVVEILKDKHTSID